MKIYYDLEPTSELVIDEKTNSSIETHAGYTSFIIFNKCGYCCNDRRNLVDSFGESRILYYIHIEVIKN